MAFTWFSAGVLDEFDTWGSYAAQLNSTAYCNSPSEACVGVGVGYTGSSVNKFFKKILPEDAADLWTSFVGYYDTNNTYSSPPEPNTVDAKFCIVKDSNGNALMYLGMPGCNSGSYGLANVYVGGTKIGVFGIAAKEPTQIEFRIRFATDGLVQVWKNGDLVLDWTGNTGTAPAHLLDFNISESAQSWCYSELTFTNEGRIGGKRPVIVPLNAPGDASDFDFHSYLGTTSLDTHISSSTGPCSFLIVSPFEFAGILERLTIHVAGSVGTAKLMLVTLNPADYTVATKVAVAEIPVTSVGNLTFYAGTDFPAWEVTTSHSLVLFIPTGMIMYRVNSELTGMHRSLRVASDTTAVDTQDYGSMSSALPYKLFAQYKVNDKTLAYQLTTTVSGALRNSYVDSHRYATSALADKALLCNLADIPVQCVSVKAAKVTIRGVAGTTLTKADFILKVDGVETTSEETLPTSQAVMSHQFNGLWTPAQINSAQIGLRTKA